ncbi:uncharacterized protein [Phyllobates terribilis]|uniref:uncharacterized protein n=1 Tax=Phyllobates terribilis TaxID=111132 RepID=UPI003CCB278C
MKTLCLLVIAALCCFAPATSFAIRDNQDENGSLASRSCLQKANSEDMVKFCCAYKKYKNNEPELNKAKKEFEDVTGCTMFGSDQNPVQVAADENDVLRNIEQLMEQQRGVDPFSIATICVVQEGIAADLTPSSEDEAGQGHKRTTRQLSSLGLDGILGVLNIVPGLLQPVLGLLRGPLGLLSGQGGLLGALLGGPGGLLGALLGVPGGLLGGQSGRQGGLLSGPLSGPGGLLSGILSVPGGLLSGILKGPEGLLGSLLGGGHGARGFQKEGVLGDLVGDLTGGGSSGGLLKGLGLG